MIVVLLFALVDVIAVLFVYVVAVVFEQWCCVLLIVPVAPSEAVGC